MKREKIKDGIFMLLLISSYLLTHCYKQELTLVGTKKFDGWCDILWLVIEDGAVWKK